MNDLKQLEQILTRIWAAFGGGPASLETFLAVSRVYRDFSAEGFKIVIRDYERIAQLAEAGKRNEAMALLKANTAGFQT